MTSQLERRLTRFPGGRAEGQISRQRVIEATQPHQAQNPPAKLKRRLQEAERPPRLPLIVNPRSLESWRTPMKRLSAPFCQFGSPWDKFHRLLPDEQAGPVICV
jgi:hypothetical protein